MADYAYSDIGARPVISSTEQSNQYADIGAVPVSPANTPKQDSPDIMGAVGKSLSDYAGNITKPGINLQLNPTMEIADRISQAAYQEAKRPALDASPFKSKGARLGQSLLIDAAAFTLAGSGVEAGALSKNFLSSKPFASDQELVSNIVKNANQVYKKAVELLKPSDISGYFEKEINHPAIVEVTDLIKKSDTPQAAIKATNNTLDQIFGERAKLLADNNKIVEPSHLVGLSDYITNLETKGLATETQIKAMNKVLDEEVNRIDPSKFDLLTAESKKEFYQGMAQKVYQKGGMDELTSGAQQAYTVLATGTKKLIEQAVPKVASINARYEGLKQGRSLLADLQSKLIENPTDALKIFTDTTGRPSWQSAVAAGVRKAPVLRDIGSYKNFSGKIESLVNEGNALRSILGNRIKAASKARFNP